MKTYEDSMLTIKILIHCAYTDDARFPPAQIKLTSESKCTLNQPSSAECMSEFKSAAYFNTSCISGTMY